MKWKLRDENDNKTWLGWFCTPAILVLWILFISFHFTMCFLAQICYDTYEERKKFWEYYEDFFKGNG